MKINKILVLGLLVATVVVSGCISLQSDESQGEDVEDENREDRFKNSQQLSVGKDAWANPVNINITDRIEPAEVEIESGRAIRWNNKRIGDIEVVMGEQSFVINSSESQMINPSGEFEYEVFVEDRSIGAGRVSIE